MQANKKPQTIILLLLASFASVSAVLFTPALPSMATTFGVSSAQGQLAMTTFLIGYALGSLPYGPFSNRFGRKVAIYCGIALAMLGSILILAAAGFHSFQALLLGRFLSALGSSVGLKITFTMISDAYNQAKATKKIAAIMLSFAIAPGIGIALGGLLTDHFGWESCFYFLTLYSAFLLGLSCFLPETGPKVEVNALKMKKVLSGLLLQLKNGKLMIAAILMGCATSFVYLFASEAPFIGMDRIGLQADEYGFLNFIPPIGMIVGSFFAHQLAEKKKNGTIITMGICIALIGSIAMLALFLMNAVNAWSLFAPMPFIYMGLSLIFSNASGLAMSSAKDKSNASAMMNFINMGVSVIALFSLESFKQHQALLLPLIFLILCILMLLLQFLFLNKESQISHE